MKYLSLFSGIGGFELGINKYYENNLRGGNRKSEEGNGETNTFESSMETAEANTQRQGDMSGIIGTRITGSPVCIGYSEIDKYAVQIYKKHYPSHKNYGDATKINASELPDFDLLVGGFPCQAFSVAGKRQGFNDTRGTLFFDVARILSEKRPKYLVLENVKGLLSHDNGKTFQTILGVLADIGYVCEWRVLNAKFFGVPQNRERVFIIGRLGGQPVGKVFFVGQNDELHTRENRPQTANTLTANYWKGPSASRTVISENTGNPGKNGDNENPVCPTIRATEYKGGDNQTVIVEPKLKQICGGSQGYRVYDPAGISSTLASEAGGLGAKTGLYTVASRIRRLTPLECERLMGYPDGWTEKGVSSTMAICVNINPVIENLLHKDIALCTTNDGKDSEVHICQNELSQFVNIVVDGLVPENFVTDTTKAGKDMVTLYSQKEISNTEELQKRKNIQEETAKQHTSKLWRIILEENSMEKLSTTLTSIHEIMTSPIFTYARTEQNIIGYIISLRSSLPHYSNEEKLYLTVKTIKSLSDTQRYKCLGNGIVSNVVAEVIEMLWKKTAPPPSVRS